MSNNFQKVFSELISIDAWHSAYDAEGRASVHVDLSFRSGDMGAEDEYEITFRVSLRKATLCLIVPESEPLGIVQSSIDREQTLEGLRKTISESRLANSASAAISAQLNASLPIEATGSIAGERTRKVATVTEFNESLKSFRTRQFNNRDGHCSWEISPEEAKVLIGKVWDPVKNPRLKVKKLSESALQPVLRVHVIANRGDIEIDRIEIKKGNVFQNKFANNRKAAAKAIIKERVLGLGLEHPNPDNDLVEIELASAVVAEEVI